MRLLMTPYRRAEYQIRGILTDVDDLDTQIMLIMPIVSSVVNESRTITHAQLVNICMVTAPLADLIGQNQRLKAIKMLREMTFAPLRECKFAVETAGTELK